MAGQALNAVRTLGSIVAKRPDRSFDAGRDLACQTAI
jgi:hypothetical protein